MENSSMALLTTKKEKKNPKKTDEVEDMEFPGVLKKSQVELPEVN